MVPSENERFKKSLLTLVAVIVTVDQCYYQTLWIAETSI